MSEGPHRPVHADDVIRDWLAAWLRDMCRRLGGSCRYEAPSAALGAFPYTRLEADRLLFALPRASDQHQHALGLVLHPGLEADSVRPDGRVAPSREVPLLPAIVRGLPLGHEAPDDRGRQVRGVLAQRGRVAEVNRMRSPPSAAPRSRTLGRDIAAAPIPVWTSRSGPCPCRTRRAGPSGSFRYARSARKASTSSSTAWARSWQARARGTSVRGSSTSSG